LKALLIAPAETPGLNPLAYATPAPLLPLLGAPLLAPLLQGLAANGIREVVLACPERRAAYERLLLDGRAWNLSIAILETGAVASRAACIEAVRNKGFHDQTMLVLPANCWADAKWGDLARRHQASGSLLTKVEADGAATGILFAEPRAAADLAAARPMSAAFRWREVASWADYWTLAREAMEHPDLGIAPPYALSREGVRLAPLAHLEPLRVQLEGAVWLGPGAAVDPGANLKGPVWIGANCRVGPGVTLESCLLEGGAQLHGPLELRKTLVVANRAISLDQREVSLLDSASPAEADDAMTQGLLQLATRTARRSASVLQPAR
jgi:NDP-sugar pyrophosphorylase family protein